MVSALAREQILQRNQRPAFASFDRHVVAPRLGQKILHGDEQIATQTSFFLPDGLEVSPFEQPRKKSLGEILRLFRLVALVPDEPVKRPPVSTAQFCERFLCCWRFPLR